jgi:light-regulated signal transduction histidine kinase (bacteriophytochrome)
LGRKKLIQAAKVSEERKQQLEQAHLELKELYAQVAEALQQSEQRYGQLAEALPLLVWTAQPDGTLSYLNRQWFDYNGVGIPQEHQSKIFERYYRVYDEQDRKFPGLGIGLYITSEIIQRHGGNIWVESTTGEGSTFSFSLPLKK